MKKIWTAGLLMMWCGPLHALSGFMCYIAPMCGVQADPDSSCDNICLSSSCPSGKPTLPAGYSGSFSRGVVTACNNNGTYSCSCGIGSGTLTCASGYSGTAKYQYINGMDNFTGCYTNGGGTSCTPGYYKLGSSCAPCPTQDGVSGTSSFGATSISSCFITKNTKLKDTSGTYEFSNNCYYTSDIGGGGIIPLPDGELKPLNPTL